MCVAILNSPCMWAGHARKTKNVTNGWTLDHVVSIDSEPKINHVTINQSCLCSGAPVKILNMETQVNLPSFQYFMCIVAHCHWEITIFWLHGVRTWETTSLEPSWTSPYDLVSFVGFNLYLFPVINSNCECNSFPWVLWVCVTNYQNWSWFWNPRKL